MTSEGTDIFDRGIPRAIGVRFRNVVLSGLATLVNTIGFGPYMPRSFSGTVLVNGQRCFLRLWFFTNGCDATPGDGNTDSMQGFQLITGFRELHDVVGEALIRWGYSHITAIDGRFGMEYVLQEGVEEGSLVPGNVTLRSYAPAYACNPYTNMIQSGPKERIYSKLTAGYFLVSRNGLYKLFMGYSCTLELQEEGSRVIWTAPASNSGARNCYLHVRADGTAAIENESVSVWTAGRIAGNGKPVSSILTVQNDRNVVLYLSDQQVAVWASNTVK